MITGWQCPICSSTTPLDHYKSSTCGASIHPDYAAAVLADRGKQQQRSGVRVSSLTSCPRKSAILSAEDVAVDPLSMLSALKGTAWHAMMERAAEKDAEVRVAGVIAGVPITGSIDRVRTVNGILTLEDWKTGKDSRAVFIRGGKAWGKEIKGEGAPKEYIVQLSIYAELYEQTFGVRPAAASIWWAFSAEMWAEAVALMSVAECLAFQPYNCGYTVEQLLQQLASGVPWQQLPLVGESIKFGTKTGCDYCEVRDLCWTEAKSAPF